MAVKADSQAHAVIGATQSFALNVLGKGQEGIAYAFFKTVESDGQQIGRQRYRVTSSMTGLYRASQPSGADGSQRRFWRLFLTFSPVGRGSPGALGLCRG